MPIFDLNITYRQIHDEREWFEFFIDAVFNILLEKKDEWSWNRYDEAIDAILYITELHAKFFNSQSITIIEFDYLAKYMIKILPNSKPKHHYLQVFSRILG